MSIFRKTLGRLFGGSRPLAPSTTDMEPLSEEERLAQENGNRAKMVENLRELLAHIGEDPHREGLLDTPKRILNAYTELFQGYTKTAEEILSTVFVDETSTSNYDQLIILRNIPYFSMCEHHQLTFYGMAHVGYIPRKCMVGISKLARLVDMHAQRMQIQEKLTADIANDIMKHLDPLGCAVLLTGQHMCMQSRGIKKVGAEMVTHAVRGAMEEGHAKMEFLELLKVR